MYPYSQVGMGIQTETDTGVRRAVAAAAMGNCLEWFDFGVYSYLAATVGEIFFPAHSTTAALLASFAVFAVAFVVRPLGGLFFGPLGDRIGRNRVLAATIVLMSGGTFIIGLLPGYDAIGVWAPMLLIVARLLQGFSTGGEYGGAATFIVEYAPDRRRGFLASWLEFGTLTGYSLGAVLVTALTVLLPHDTMTSWGWRIPFLCAGPLGLFGLYLRLKLEDTPEFLKLEAAGKLAKAPLRESLIKNWRQMLKCVGLVLILNVAYYTVLTYLPTYLSDRLHIGDTRALLMILAIYLGMMAVITFVGRMSDRIGRKPVLLASCIGFIVLAWPAFALMMQGTAATTIAGLAILGFLVVLLSGTMPATLPAIFPTRVRYGAFAVSYNVSTSLFGGTAPLVITWLIALTGNNFMPAFYLIGAAAIAIVPILLIRETAGAPLPGALAPDRAAAIRDSARRIEETASVAR